MDQTKKFGEFLVHKGLKATNQRKAILKTFLNSQSHCSTEDLYLRLKRKHPKIGYATVHRTLKLLVECGIAIEQNFRDGHVRFESAREDSHHDHLVCQQCGLIIEFEEPQIEELQNKVALAHQFIIKNHRHELYGLCSRCHRK